jgi:invasion protein IalB
MSSLAELPELVGFFSYSREDDEAFKGMLSALRDGIQRELSAQLGRSKRTFRLWQDQVAIAPGKLWELEIEKAVGESFFFLPIVTPRSTSSKYCKFEFESFLAREKAIGRSDLIFPILYISVSALENEAKWRDDPVLSTIGRRQYVDWRHLRHLDAQTTAVREQIERLCQKIVEALNEPWTSLEERRRMEEGKARQQAEEEARRLEIETKRRAEEEQHQRQAQAKARQQAEEEARWLDAETKRRAEEENDRKRTEAEAERRTEEERRRREAEAKLRTEQDQAFAAAKRADVVGEIDTFLRNHPETRHTPAALTLRAALLVREEACKDAIASDVPAVLKAFLKTYRYGTLADQVRERLRHLEPRKVWRIPRAIRVALLLLLGLGVFAIIEGIPPTDVPSGSQQWNQRFQVEAEAIDMPGSPQWNQRVQAEAEAETKRKADRTLNLPDDLAKLTGDFTKFTNLYSLNNSTLSLPDDLAKLTNLTYAAWKKFCLKGQDANAKQVCFTAKDGRIESGQTVIAAVVIEPEGDPKKTLRVTLPLGMQLVHGTRLIVDKNSPQQSPYVICFANGCISDYEVTSELLASMKKGQSLVVQAINSNGAPLTLPLPLAEFAKAYDGPPGER